MRQLVVLQKARHQLYEAEEIGNHTLQVLNQQEQQLRHVRDNVHHVSEEVSVAGRILNRMMSFWRR